MRRSGFRSQKGRIKMAAFVLGCACVLMGIYDVIIWESVGVEVMGLASVIIGGVLIQLGREGAE
jgi:hypothetical protein